MTNYIDIIAAIVGSGGVSGYVAHFFTRKKYLVEVKQAAENVETTAIENDVKLSNHYRDILDDLQARYEKRAQEFEKSMQKKIQILEAEISMKDRKIRLLETEIKDLKKQLKRRNGKTTA
ncbi:MAG: hypothetical protein LC096_05460 [Bacteroidia bacterium]|nr:hypothetical protein [Bacteroidia bacterium]